MNLSLHTFVFDFEIVELFSNFVVWFLSAFLGGWL
jgi:hypothetical protein